MLLAFALLLVVSTAVPAQDDIAPEKFAGTYRIENWQALQAQELYHFFYLHRSGKFLLAAEWPGVETSRAVGAWYVAGGRLHLGGRTRVETNQGSWQVPYQRTFVISVGDHGFRLKPVPEKNRFGLLGWPDAYVYYRDQPAPNLPSGEMPTTTEGMLQRIETLEQALQ